MNDIVKIWLRELYSAEIENQKLALENERLWENGYDGEEPNPHTENIMNIEQYIAVLEHLVGSV